MALDPHKIRHQFPALQRPEVYLDNPGGTQVAKHALDRMLEYLIETNSNHEGVFATSRASDEIIARSRAAMADFLNAAGPEEIIFGANMTTLAFHLARSLARQIRPGDAIVVTRLDHDANISPWLLLAEDRGASIKWVDFNPSDGTLDLGSFEKAMEKKPALVCLGYASNALGTINPVEKLTEIAHRAGALVFIDAVHYAPHGPIDVRAGGFDFLACSPYKFFGPHMGVLYGRRGLLDELFAYKVRPASDDLPTKFETGTQNHEAIAGLLGTLEYFEWLGREYGKDFGSVLADRFQGRALLFKQALAAIRAHEKDLTLALLKALQDTPSATVYGLTDPARFEERAPTFAFRLPHLSPRRIAEEMDKDGIFVWEGNYYALEVTRRLGVEETGGMVRVGAVHYNTRDEIARFGKSLARIAKL
ncbi:MAG: cysteine desulfurase-like protein [Candidatus Aminicenantes bacterium]|nr:cysteine desulfurase-like protein [Candidatus Aminicenantes bacterium]